MFLLIFLCFFCPPTQLRVFHTGYVCRASRLWCDPGLTWGSDAARDAYGVSDATRGASGVNRMWHVWGDAAYDAARENLAPRCRNNAMRDASSVNKASYEGATRHKTRPV